MGAEPFSILDGVTALRISLVATVLVELAVVALLVMADDFGQGRASQPDLSVLVVKREVLLGNVPDGARNPQLGRISRGEGIDFVVGYDIPRMKGQDPSGRLRVFRNVGTGASPLFKDGFWLDERVPSARIPVG
jgi:hypothetical protein